MLRAIDLFCGVGGFSRGFEEAGFEIVLGIDNWDVALETFKRNHKNAMTLNADVTKIPDSYYQQYAGKIDVVIGGPPCQGFSMAGKRNPDDERNTLFEEMIRAVSIIKPKIVVIENVVGLLSMSTPENKLVRDVIIEKLKSIGYETECRILNAADYGVPQKRKRVLFIASESGNIGFPEPTHSDKPAKGKLHWITVGDALGNVPDTTSEEYGKPESKFQKMMSDGVKTVYNHEPMKHAPEIIKRMSFVPHGGNWKNIPKEYYNVGGEHSNNYRRLHPDQPSITIKHATKSMIIHPYYDRCLTVREVARLQSFYDSFIFAGTRFEQHQQLANAVPPLLGFAIAQHIKSSIGEPHEEISVGRTGGESPTRIRFIDLFSGIGGFRTAMEKHGGKCVFSSDIDKWANETYFSNFGEYPAGDITKIDAKDIPEHDILCAGFPCQAFSIAGRRKGFEDTRGTLFFDVARIIREKKPKAFILENVRGITNHDGGKTIEVIRNTLKELGYSTHEKVMNAKNYGLPQNRERWICVGFRNDISPETFSFPDPVNLEKRLSDIIEKEAKKHDITETASRHIRSHYKKFLEKNGDPENTEFTIATEVRPSRCIMRNDGISPCLTAKMGTGGNNVPVIVELNRKLTVRECLRLMGFPDSFKIKEGSYQSYKQIGNSVPVNIIEKTAEKVIESINRLSGFYYNRKVAPAPAGSGSNAEGN